MDYLEFGQAFKKARIARRITLREFCLKNNLDPGNMSKIERGLCLPPRDPKKLMKIILMLIKDKSHFLVNHLFELALEDHCQALREKFWDSLPPRI